MMSVRSIFNILCLCGIIIFCGCWNYWCLSWWIVKKKKVPEYPTSWIFEKNIEEVIKILKRYSGYKDSSILEYCGKVTHRWLWCDSALERKYGIITDTFRIDYACECWRRWAYNNPETYVYVNRLTGKPYEYDFECHLHLTAIDSNHTRVKVFVIRPYLELHEPCLPYVRGHGEGCVFGHRWPKYVKPTTLEAYAILLTIGKVLGEDHKMPPLKLPEK